MARRVVCACRSGRALSLVVIGFAGWLPFATSPYPVVRSVGRQPFRVFTLRNPSRLVIDIGSRFAARRVSVYFSDIERRPGEPAIVAVRRTVDTPAVARGALQRLFAGPTQPEIARGLQLFPGRVTGFADLSVRDGVARVRLLGGCPARDADIRRQVRLTLLQFPTVDRVLIRC